MGNGDLYVKPGVKFDTIRPAGFRILTALGLLARRRHLDVVITCGTEGHGPLDPHTQGEAYDVRSTTLPDRATKLAVLLEVIDLLAEGSDVDMLDAFSFASGLFYGVLEDPGGPNEHLHLQRRKGRQYSA